MRVQYSQILYVHYYCDGKNASAERISAISQININICPTKSIPYKNLLILVFYVLSAYKIIKKITQISLLLLIFVLSIIFYNKQIKKFRVFFLFQVMMLCATTPTHFCSTEFKYFLFFFR